MVDLKTNDFEKSVKEIDLGHDTQDETLKSIDKAWYVPPEIIPDAEMASKNEKESRKSKNGAKELTSLTLDRESFGKRVVLRQKVGEKGRR